MPSYNHQDFIDDAISSIIEQTVTDFELIIVDDFSSDNSRNIIEKWCLKDNRIKTIFHRKNEGISKTANDGIRNAKGKYIAMMASDDMFIVNAFEKVFSVLEDSGIGGTILEAYCIDEKNLITGLFSDVRGKPSKYRGNFFLDMITLGKFVCTGIFKKSIIKTHNIFFDERFKYVSDWLFWLDLSAVCNFFYISEPLYLYRIHKKQSLKYRAVGPYDETRIYDIILDKHGKKLDNHGISFLLKHKGLDLARSSKPDYKKCRKYLNKSLLATQSPIERAKLTLIKILSYPAVFELYLKIEKLRNQYLN